MTKSPVTDEAVEALRSLTNLLAGSRRPHGYVIATCLPLDHALERACRVLEQYEANRGAPSVPDPVEAEREATAELIARHFETLWVERGEQAWSDAADRVREMTPLDYKRARKP